MKQSFKLTIINGDHFYYDVNSPISGFMICEEFVKFCGVTSQDITVTISSTRPHQKGWKVVKLFNNPVSLDHTRTVFIGKEKRKFETLYYHRGLFKLYNTNVGWIKVDNR